MIKKANREQAVLPKWRPSLKLIAEECGVTIATVSRILNGKRNFNCNPETAKKVHEVAEKHKYMVNLLTLGMRNGQSRSIGVISAERLSFQAEIVHGIHHALAENDYVMIHEWNDAMIHTDKGDRERVMLMRLLEHRVDGIILYPTNEDATELYFREVRERGIPLVILDIPLSSIGTDFIGTDNIDCGRQAADFFNEQGHRCIFSLVQSAQTLANPIRERIKGFEEALAMVPNVKYRRIEFDQVLTGFNDRSAIVKNNMDEVIEPIIAAREPVAVFCGNDKIAAHLYRLIKAKGKTIPNDVSVLGVGNLDFGELLDPPLASFDQHAYDIGFHAATGIIKRIKQDAKVATTPIQQTIKSSLIPRSSVRSVLSG